MTSAAPVRTLISFNSFISFRVLRDAEYTAAARVAIATKDSPILDLQQRLI
jgi:hypothetical protein